MLSKLQSRAFASAKDLTHGVQARQSVMDGWEKLAEAVAGTLGPKGRNVVIEQSFGAPKVTKDGVTVAKAIDLKDKQQNIGVQLAKQVASKTNDLAGDGTTTATILGYAIYKEGCKAVAAGMNPMDLKRGVDHAVKLVLSDLEKQAQPISKPDEIEQVATIAANSDQVIGKMIRDAYEKVGKDGTITVQEGKTVDHELDVVDGCKFDRGFISPYFITDTKSQKVELEDPLILLFDKKISSIQSVLPLLEQVVKARKPLLIIAEDIDGEALSTLVVNKLRGGLNVCAVKAPGFGDNRKAQLQDLAVLTGGELISEDTGAKLEEVELSSLGSARKVTISKDETTILEGKASKTDMEERGEQLRQQMDATTSTYEKDKLKERLAKLSGGVAVIKVGGASEVEVGEVKDRLNDALCATRCAVKEGIVNGGGTALLYASTILDELKLGNFDQNVGVQIVKTAIQAPCARIVKNAGKEGAVVVQHLLERNDRTMGYDAQSLEYVNMMEKGIIDPTMVVRTALIDASSVASLLMTTETLITDVPEPKGPAPPMPSMGPGMYD